MFFILENDMDKARAKLVDEELHDLLILRAAGETLISMCHDAIQMQREAEAGNA